MIVSLSALIALFPLFSILVIVIKLQGGPVFFIHSRVGINGNVFPLIKFRTMIPDAQSYITKMMIENKELQQEWHANFRLKDDPRVTRFGKFLRKSKLDEIPQFFNVLMGQMSVVGPRPLTQEEFALKFTSKNQIHTYQSVLPGITGSWQTSDEVEFTTRISMELGYIDEISFRNDMKIMWLTARKILTNVF